MRDLSAARAFGSGMFERDDLFASISSSVLTVHRMNGSGSITEVRSYPRAPLLPTYRADIRTKRLAVKDTHLSEKGWLDGKFAWKFWMDIKGKKVPREAVMHRQMSLADQQNEFIVQYREYAVHPWDQMYRLYMEHCEHYDLQKLINNHSCVFDLKDESGNDIKR